MVSRRKFPVITSNGKVHYVKKWFIKLSQPLLKLTGLIPRTISKDIIPNPNPATLPPDITSVALESIINWCNNHRRLKAEEWREWESRFFSLVQSLGTLEQISLAARSLKIHALRESLKQRRIRMVEMSTVENSSLSSPATMQKRVANKILSRGGRRKLKRSRKSTLRGPSRLRNMSCT